MENTVPFASPAEKSVPIGARIEFVTSFVIIFSDLINGGSNNEFARQTGSLSKQLQLSADRCKTQQQNVFALECNKPDPCLVVCISGHGS